MNNLVLFSKSETEASNSEFKAKPESRAGFFLNELKAARVQVCVVQGSRSRESRI